MWRTPRRTTVLALLLPAAGCQLIAGIDSRSVGTTTKDAIADDTASSDFDSASDAGSEGGEPCQTNGEKKCALYNVAMTCENGWWTQTACAGDTPGCRAGDCVSSCTTLGKICGSNHDRNCCESNPVPGGTVARSYDGVNFPDASFVATVAPFRMDVFEVTVGRFRSFVTAYPDSLPTPGAGKSLDKTDLGWSGGWRTQLPAGDVATSLVCSGGGQSWTGSSINDSKPINCVNWYLAYAFCIWDGGRLPTEAVWNFAAAGGDASNVREYPWDASVPPVDRAHAVYDCLGRGDCGGAPDGAPPYALHDVGSVSPLGDGRFGQADLAGNVSEWLLDVYRAEYVMPCDNCVDHGIGNERAIRGGNYGSAGAFPTIPALGREQGSVLVAYRYSRAAEQSSVSSRIGFRCVR